MKKFLLSIFLFSLVSLSEGVSEERVNEILNERFGNLLESSAFNEYVRSRVDIKLNDFFYSEQNSRFIVLGPRNNINTNKLAENSYIIGKGNTVNNMLNSFIIANDSYLGLNNNDSEINSSIIIGNKNILKGSNSAIIGNGIKINENFNDQYGHDVFVLGAQIEANNVKNAIILGKESTGVENALSIGKKGSERKIVNVSDGAINENSTDAITGKQLYAPGNINISAWKEKLGILTPGPSNANNMPQLDLINQNTNNNVWNDTSDSSFALGWGNRILKIDENNKSQNVYTIGKNNEAYSRFVSIMGIGNYIYGDNSAIIGNNIIVNKDKNKDAGSDVFVLGANTQITGIKDAIVLGNKSEAVSKALSIGNNEATRKLVYLSEGEISKTSKEAINGSQIYNMVNDSSTVEFNSSKAIEVKDGSISYNKLDEALKAKIDAKAILDDSSVTSEKIKEGSIEKKHLNESFLNTLATKKELETESTKREETLENLDRKINAKVDNLVFETSNGQIVKRLDDVSRELAGAVAMANMPFSGNSNFSMGISYGRSANKNALALGIAGSAKMLGYKASIATSGKNLNFGAGISLNLGENMSDIEKLEKENKKLNEKISNLEKEINEIKKLLNK